MKKCFLVLALLLAAWPAVAQAPSGTVEVTNLNLPPAWVMWLGCFGLFLFGIAFAVLAGAVIMLLGQIKSILQDVQGMVNGEVKGLLQDVNRNLMPSVDATLKNVKFISDDARTTTHNVTGTVNRVSHLVGVVVAKMESPVVKSAGAIAGLVAGARAMGGKKEVVVKEQPAKRSGLLGFFK